MRVIGRIDIKNEYVIKGIHLEGLRKLGDPDKFFNDFLDYISIDEDEFWNTIDQFRPNHLWEKVNGDWRLKHTVHDH